MNYGHSVPNVHSYGHNPISTIDQNMNNYIGQKRSYNDLYITSANNTSCMNMINDTASTTNIPFYSQHNSNDNIYQSNDYCSFNKRQRFDDTQTYQCDHQQNSNIIYTTSNANNNNNNHIFSNMLSFQCDNNNFGNDYGVNNMNNMNNMNYMVNNCQRGCHSYTVNNNHNAFNATISPISPTASTNSAAFNHNRQMPNTVDMTMTSKTNNNSISPKIEYNNNNNNNTFDLPPIVDTKMNIKSYDNTIENKTICDGNNNNKHIGELPPILDHTDNDTDCDPYNNNYNHFPDFCNITNDSLSGLNTFNGLHALNGLNESVSHIAADNINTNNNQNNNNDQNTNTNVNKIIFSPNITLNINDNNKSVVQSASCHQCKTKKDISILFYCTKKKPCINNAYKTKVIKCRKKYCKACMTKYFQESDVAQFKKFKDSLSWSFDCPSCQNVCSCRACKRKRARNNTKNDKNNNVTNHSKIKQQK